MTTPLPLSPLELDWVARIRAGDGAAFEAMFRQYYEPLLRFALTYLPVRESAEDLVQDVFYRIWEHRERWAVRTTLAAYLYAAVRHRALDSLSEHAYGIYLVHYAPVVWLQYALLGSDLPVPAKAATVFAIALAVSWAASAGSARLLRFDLTARRAIADRSE